MDDAGETIDGTVAGDRVPGEELAAAAAETNRTELVLAPAAPVVPWYARPGVQTAAAATAGLIAGGTAFLIGRRLGASAARSLAGRALGEQPAESAARGPGSLPQLRSGTYLVHVRIVTRP